MSEFIKILLDSRQRFRAVINFDYNGCNKTLFAVVDTGCNHSHFSANLLYGIKMGNSEEEREQAIEVLHQYKRKVLSAGAAVSIGRGVESQGLEMKKPLLLEEQVAFKNLKIQEQVKNVKVDGHVLGDYEISVSYDTFDVALIGMDFIKEWDLHIGMNKADDIILLACHNQRLNNTYYQELNKCFDMEKIS